MTLFAESPGLLSGPWRLVLPLVLAALAVFFLLPRPRGRSVLLGALCGIAALVLGGLVVTWVEGSFSPEVFLFYAFSGLAILGGALLVTQRNPARAAISFALVVMSVCGLFLLQAAPFLMAAAIIIYAGAIIVTFLFVLMLAQQSGFSNADDRSREPFTASLAGFVMLGAILLVLDHVFPDSRNLPVVLDRVSRAAEQETASDVRQALGERKAFMADLQQVSARFRGAANSRRWAEAVEDIGEELGSERATAASLKLALNKLLQAGRQLQQENRPAALPADNVAALGRLLFSDYILAVELAGTLLLVATIGAIAITARRAEKPA